MLRAYLSGKVSVLSEVEHRKDKESDPDDNNPYIFTTLGVAFLGVFFVLGFSVTFIASWPFLIAAAALLGKGIGEFAKTRRALSKPPGGERELLSAIRDNGGSITPAEAAMETSLTVREADAMLSELAGGGHVAVKSRNGALFYSLPSRDDPALESRG